MTSPLSRHLCSTVLHNQRSAAGLTTAGLGRTADFARRAVRDLA
jgi:hypothetical protein